MELRERGRRELPDLRRYLDLVALGTIADLVPIVEENRVLVKHGLRELATSPHPGVAALKAVSGVTSVSTAAVGFRLAPRLNAGGRLADASRSVELLTTDDQARADQLAAALDEENRARQAIERQMYDGAVAMIDRQGGIGNRRSIVLASADWHPGVVGIVASRLVERYYRPTILIANSPEAGVARGSGRSIRGLNIYEALGACRAHLEGFGGHHMAAGLSIRAERVPAFARDFEAAVVARTTPVDLVPVREIDCELAFGDVSDRSLDELERLEPFGPANPEPVFAARGVCVRACRIVGDSHLKLFLDHNGCALPAIGFGMAERSVETGARLDVLYSPMRSHWNGVSRAEIRVRDFRPAR